MDYFGRSYNLAKYFGTENMESNVNLDSNVNLESFVNLESNINLESNENLESQESILSELRKTREDVSRNLRENTEAVRDLRGEIGSIWREMRVFIYFFNILLIFN